MAKVNYTEQGQTGLAEFSGQIMEDFLREMRGQEAYKRYNEMRYNSPVVSAMLLAIEQAIRGVSWEFRSEMGADDARLELLNDARDGMSLSWNDHITECLTFLPFGFSIFEIVYRRDERNRVLWRKFAPRGQDTVYKWLFDERGGLAGVVQRVSAKSVELPIEKLLLYRTRIERGNPEGRSILRSAWIPYYYAKHIQQIEAIGIERDLAGLPMVRLPQGADADESSSTSDAGKAAKIVRNVRNDEQAGIVIPDGWEFELLSSGGSRQFDTDAIVKRYESRMLMSALAQFLMLGQEQVGSLALSKDQTDFFTMSVNATADIIGETFTKYAVPRLLAYNGYDAEGIVLEHTPAGDVDIQQVADFLQKTGSLITWRAEDEVWLRQLGKLPESSVEDLQAFRDEREQRRAEAVAALQQRVQTDDKMAATVYNADAPDDARRRRREREWQKVIETELERQKKRILKAAKDMAKNG